MAAIPVQIAVQQFYRNIKNMKIVLLYTASWLGMVILAILNGVIREKVYGKFMGELTAQQLSTLAGIIL